MELVNKHIGNWGRYQGYIYALMAVVFATAGVQVMVFAFTGATPKARCALPWIDYNATGESPVGTVAFEYSSKILDKLGWDRFYSKADTQGGKETHCYYCPGEVQEVLASRLKEAANEKIAGLGIDGNFTRNMSSSTNVTEATTETTFLQSSNPTTSKTCQSSRSIQCPTQNIIYDRSQFHSSITMELNMVCGKSWQHSLASSAFMFGIFGGAIVCGIMSDKYGRRSVLIATCVIGVLSYHFLILAVMRTKSIVVLCLVHIINGACSHGAYLTAFVMCMECIGGSTVAIAGLGVHFFFVLGYVFVGVMAINIHNWQWLHLVLSLPSLCLIPISYIAPESIRWHIVHGHEDAAEAAIIQAAAVNNLHVDERQLAIDVRGELAEEEKQRRDSLAEKVRRRSNVSAGSKRNSSVVPMTDQPAERRATAPETFTGNISVVLGEVSVLELITSHWDLTRVSLAVLLCWFAASMAYYGLAMNSGELPGNDYTNYIVLGVVEVPGLILTIPAINIFGRRPTLITLFTLSGAAVLTCTFLPEWIRVQFPWLLLVLASIGKMGAAGSFGVAYIHTAEIFPTVVRNAGLGLASTSARLASIAAPQIYLLGHQGHGADLTWLPFCVYGSVALTAAAAALLLPETKGCALPETLEDSLLVAKGLWGKGNRVSDTQEQPNGRRQSVASIAGCRIAKPTPPQNDRSPKPAYRHNRASLKNTLKEEDETHF